MDDALESDGQLTAAAGQPGRDDHYQRPSRLGQAAAWVGIIAGVLFVVAVIFYSGVLLGWSSTGHYGWHRSGWVDGVGGSTGRCPMMDSGGMMRPDGWGPPWGQWVPVGCR